MSELKSERLLTGKFVLLLAAAFGVFLANGIITPVLPVFVKDDLGGGDVAVGVVVAVQAISAFAIRPWSTPKFNEWGVKPCSRLMATFRLLLPRQWLSWV